MKNLMNCPIISFALSFFMKLTYYSLPIEAIMPLKEHGSPRISIIRVPALFRDNPSNSLPITAYLLSANKFLIA